MSDDTPLLMSRDGACVILTLNRPDSLNALSGTMRRSIVAALAALDADDACRVAILTGRGRAFSAGLDVKELAASGVDVSANVDRENVVAAIERFSKPLIVAVNGLAVTGGFEIALACDVIYASEDAVFIDTHVKVGLAPGWGLSQRLSRVVGVHRAKELSLSATPLTAREAEGWGLVNRVFPAVDLLSRSVELAHAIAALSPASVRSMKSLIDRGHAMALGEALVMEATSASAANANVVMTGVDFGAGSRK